MTTAATISYSGRRETPWKPWWPIFLGLAILYLPTFYDLATSIWQSEAQGHGPIVLAVALYIMWQKRALLVGEMQGRTNPVVGTLLLMSGLLLYVVGRSQGMLMFEVGSEIPVLVGILLVTRGAAVLRKLWFPLFFLLFMVPLPGILVGIITGPLKQDITGITVALLHWAGYPIGRSGVTITIGMYQLLVADACSGIRSIFSLSAMGLLYLYFMQYRSWSRNGLLIASFLPIAFVANLLRVIILVLITYHFGDEVGQGFIHKFAGALLFIVSLLFMVAFDALLGWTLPRIFRAESK